ncbi:MAG: SDR family NAD(P)-dependent oxidoreductase [Candidatus Obscuribacterales bacterium]|nr:SDR family NAD(P)-dependent oxidoreductase [Candidatus Obscuribacterales bacterium]
MTKKRNVLITGGAGFIGSHLSERLLKEGDQLVVLDSFNPFYNRNIKKDNIKECLKNPGYTFLEGDLRNDADLERCFSHGPFDVVVHLAAMAGVRPSLADPSLYMDINILGTQKLVDQITKRNPGCRLVFGSSSSVYGARSGESFNEDDRVDTPLSPYAASKAAGEAILYSAHHTTGLPVVNLRFFTVFGPRQRPDLAIHKFCKLIDRGEPLEVYGDGTSKRDYTYVADIVAGIEKAMEFPFNGWEIINLGRSEPVLLMDMIGLIEKYLNKKAKLIHKPMQIGDMPYTYANIERAQRLLGYKPQTPFEEGIKNFVNWYLTLKQAGPA